MALAHPDTATALPPPSSGWLRPVGWLRRHFFSGPFNTVLSALLAGLALWVVPPMLGWVLLDATWLVRSAEACRTSGGACWAIIGEKHRLILFGTYPFAEQWRGVLVCALVLGVVALSTWRRLWSPWLAVLWAAGLGAAFALQRGGVLGLSYVPTEKWGGLPLILLLFVGTVSLGLPLAILAALGRRSRLPVIKGVSVAYIEIVRGVPLVNVLFLASLILPLFLPEGMNLDKLLRAQVGLVIFFGAYAAEVVRGGLQAVPRGQYEAAEALGLSYFRRTVTIVLPQALRIVIPALVNDIIRAFKNTSVLVIIGLFDLLGATKAAIEDPAWSRHYVEAYLFIAAIYFVFCVSLSKYSERLERDLSRGRNL